MLFLKGQIISKGLFGVLKFSKKKQMNEFIVVVNMNLFIHFLGEFEDTKKSFRNYLTFSSVIMISSVEIDREMAILLVNSDFRSNVKDSDEWDDYSPCDEHFDTRYAIGTHAADYHELKDWSSLDAHPTYVST